MNHHFNRNYFLCRIIQNYAMRDEAGALAPPSMDYNKVTNSGQLRSIFYVSYALSMILFQCVNGPGLVLWLTVVKKGQIKYKTVEK